MHALAGRSLVRSGTSREIAWVRRKLKKLNTTAEYERLSVKPKIAILSVARTLIVPDGDSPKRLEFAVENLENKYRYAHHYNYDFIPVFADFKDPELPAPWSKISALQHYLPRYDWIWCADLDLFITNAAMSLEQHVLKDVPKNASFVLSRDCNNFNTGSFFIRNTPEAFQFLDAVWALRHNTTLEFYDIWWEQSAIIHVLNNNVKSLTDGMHLLPQSRINSFRCECGDEWKLGDFVVHFAGIPNKQAEWAAVLEEGGDALRTLLP